MECLAMDTHRRKRLRSNEFETTCTLQHKIHVNEKIMNATSTDKMKQIYEKTIGMLFEAARSTKSKDVDTVHESLPLWKQIILSGNGSIDLHNNIEHTDFLVKRQRSKCCDREAYINIGCSSCPMTLCEECGYSCAECGRFLCNKCVSIFGCGTTERPICEKCCLFN